MHPKIEDWEVFCVRVALICQLIINATDQSLVNQHLFSVDEKTGIQALERFTSIAPKSKGLTKRKDSEYKRNGTTCLTAALNVATGKIANNLLRATRKEPDFLEFITTTVDLYPKEDKIIFIADQLNTHLSESLVLYVAKLIDFKGDLGIKGKQGILKSMQSRKEFLENPAHRVRFVYTPKHCSWLNPIENWFAKVQRHVVKNGNFASVEQLVEKIDKYICYFNRDLFKPLNWKFKGFDKNKPLESKKVV